MASIQSNSNSEQGHPPRHGEADVAPAGFNSTWDYIVYAIATGFAVGLIPFAPGTFGSILGVVLWIVLAMTVESEIVLAGVVIFLILISLPICGRAGRILGKSDPGSVVLDEIVAVPVVYFLCSVFGPGIVSIPVHSDVGMMITPEDQLIRPYYLLLGLILFRIFDIAKPWPIRRVERLKGGMGIVADDIAAAIYAAICLTVILYIARSIS